jgi:ADP-ribose pyrophosphatase
MDETAHLFIGEELARLAQPPDDTEFIEVQAFPFTDALQMVLRGEIVDGMTIIAILHAARLKGL